MGLLRLCCVACQLRAGYKPQELSKGLIAALHEAGQGAIGQLGGDAAGQGLGFAQTPGCGQVQRRGKVQRLRPLEMHPFVITQGAVAQRQILRTSQSSSGAKCSLSTPATRPFCQA